MSEPTHEATPEAASTSTAKARPRPVIVTSAVSAFAGAALAVLALGGSTEKLVVSELVLKDRTGDVRAEMSVDKTGTVGFVMFDAEGNPQVEIGCTTEGVSMIGLVKPGDDQPRVILRASGESHGLLTLGPDGAPATLIGDGGNGPIVRLQGDGAGQNVMLGASPGGWVNP